MPRPAAQRAAQAASGLSGESNRGSQKKRRPFGAPSLSKAPQAFIRRTWMLSPKSDAAKPLDFTFQFSANSDNSSSSLS